MKDIKEEIESLRNHLKKLLSTPNLDSEFVRMEEIAIKKLIIDLESKLPTNER